MADRYQDRTAGEGEPWRRDRYGSRYDQDRTNYGSGWDREQRSYGRGQSGNDLHPEYVTWRNEQLRRHDRDYETWRNDRQRQYDDDYRRRRNAVGRGVNYSGASNMSRGMPPQDVDMSSGDYSRRTGGSFGRSGEPSGRLEPRYLSASHARRPAEPRSYRNDDRFDDEPSEVRAATDGWDTRRAARDFEDHHWRDRDHDHRDRR
jgi:hypothetical protein